jgi:hypothetical protein
VKVRILRTRSAQPDPDSVIGRLVREARHTQGEEAELPAGKPVSTFDGEHVAYVADDGVIRVYKGEPKPIKTLSELQKRHEQFWRKK